MQACNRKKPVLADKKCECNEKCKMQMDPCRQKLKK